MTPEEQMKYYYVPNVGVFKWSETIGIGKAPEPGVWYYNEDSQKLCCFHEGLPFSPYDRLLEKIG